MPASLRYGIDCLLSFELPSEALVADCAAPHGQPLADPARAVAEALAAPHGLPPLARATVPGDRVVLALEPGVPQAGAIVAALVETLLGAGAAPRDITVLRTASDVEADAPDPRRLLPAAVGAAVGLETHNPDDRAHVSYLAATPKGKPIYLNRLLCDADLVVPIGCLRCPQAVSYHGVYGGLYPTFSDAATLERFRNPSSSDSHSQAHARKRHLVEKVGWLSGVLFVVQVIPGPGDSLLEVLAGEAAEVARVGQQRCERAWSFAVPQRASLVVAAVTGEAAGQTWENVGRALAAALRVVEDDGTIALCTELSAPPGPAVQGLAQADDLRAALRQIRKHKLADTLPATELAVALARAKVYLLSHLPADQVEELGVAAVSDPADIVRLAGRHASCVLLGDAQYAVAVADE